MSLRVVRVPDGWVLSEADSPWRLLRHLGVFATRREAAEVSKEVVALSHPPDILNMY